MSRKNSLPLGCPLGREGTTVGLYEGITTVGTAVGIFVGVVFVVTNDGMELGWVDGCPVGREQRG